MRRGLLLTLGCVAFGGAAGSFAACGGTAAGLCDYGECAEIVEPDSGFLSNDAASPPESNDAGVDAPTTPEDAPTTSDDGPTTSDDAPADAPPPSCGSDASVAYCGADAGCVDTTTSAGNCSACGHACAAPANGLATCVASQCGVACDPSYVLCDDTCHSTSAPPTDACLVTEQFGVFVAPGGTGAGTRAAPLGSIQAGISAAATNGVSRVYVCAGTFASGVTFASTSSAVTVYGGFQCSNWSYAPATNHVVVAPASGVALTFNGSTAAIGIENIEFDAAAATGFDAKGNGASSVAAFAANAANVTLTGVILKAGSGVNGVTPGAPTTNYAGGATAPGGEGPALGDAGMTTPGSIACNDGTTSSKGGPGGESSMAADDVTPGATGTSTPSAASSTTGFDGAGGAEGTSVLAPCTGGHPGANGAAASAASGATTWGTLATSGWTPAAGANGANGDPGQGGGGGGGSTIPPVAGGSGGAGGCGGAGGLAGTGGGSSFALLAFNSPIALVGCTLEAGNGGAGGAGGIGQDGQGGGASGASTCGGGYGGNGAGGGGGGGAAAGLSVGVAYVGTAAPTLDSTTTFSSGTVSGATAGGGGGAGGTNVDGMGTSGNSGGTGKAGTAAKLQSLD